MTESTSAAAAARTSTGVTAALAAFLSWGLLPLYFHLIGPGVTPWEITIHRVVWACVLLSGLVLLTGRRRALPALCRRPAVLAALAGSAALIAGNWGTFIWAVTHDQVVQSSLGYYINPLLNVFLGFCFLGERLRPVQLVAVAIAAAGVLVSLLAFGRVPWIALILAGCFGGYGLIRKQVAVDSATGLWVETLFLTPVALLWLALLYRSGEAAFALQGLSTDLLLAGSGVITVVPLVAFAMAARRLRLGTVGLFQYLTPTAHLLIGVFVFGEPFTRADAVTFGCIWVGLVLYTGDLWRFQRRGYGQRA